MGRMRTNLAYEDPYDRDDPKHPTWVDDVIDRADQMRDEI